MCNNTHYFHFDKTKNNSFISYEDAMVKSEQRSTENKIFPHVNLDGSFNGGIPPDKVAHKVTNALRDSGFLIVTAPGLTLDLQRKALQAASRILEMKSSSIVLSHPTDPKKYSMLHGIDFDIDDCVDSQYVGDLKAWYKVVRSTKDILLRCIAIGLGIGDAEYFVNLHDEHNDSLRLLCYPPGDENTSNRCKEHSDYGTLTLLLTDGVGGLEAFVNGRWMPVPYVKGTIVVNIGTLLSQWTKNELSATLHRVAGPASIGSNTPNKELIESVSFERISIAYFADPNKDIASTLKNVDGSVEVDSMTVSDYIQWRSGGVGADREGVAFTTNEKDRLSYN